MSDLDALHQKYSNKKTRKELEAEMRQALNIIFDADPDIRIIIFTGKRTSYLYDGDCHNYFEFGVITSNGSHFDSIDIIVNELGCIEEKVDLNENLSKYLVNEFLGVKLNPPIVFDILDTEYWKIDKKILDLLSEQRFIRDCYKTNYQVIAHREDGNLIIKYKDKSY